MMGSATPAICATVRSARFGLSLHFSRLSIAQPGKTQSPWAEEPPGLFRRRYERPRTPPSPQAAELRRQILDEGFQVSTFAGSAERA